MAVLLSVAVFVVGIRVYVHAHNTSLTFAFASRTRVIATGDWRRLGRFPEDARQAQPLHEREKCSDKR